MMKICSTCQNPLTVLVNPGDGQDADVVDASSSTHHAYMVDDDVELQCGCHFHWFVDSLRKSRIWVQTANNELVLVGNVF